MKAEIHCHTFHSRGTKITHEGLNSPSEIVRHAKRTGLEAIAITDHDNIRGWDEAAREAKKQGILFIPGIEIATARGHVLGLGINENIKSGMSVDGTIEMIREQGGIAVAAHPFDIKNYGIKDEMTKADAVEAFNALSVDKISNVFTERKAKKLGKAMVSGSDAHTLDMVGVAATELDFTDLDSLLKQIRMGKTAMNKNYVPLKSIVSWSKRRFELSYNDVLRYINDNYWQPKAWFAQGMLNSFVFSRREKMWRALAAVSAGATMCYGSIKVLSYY